MLDTNDSKEELKTKLKIMEKQLENEASEKEKLQTRLRGYETVAKLASKNQNENTELKRQVDELQREIANLRAGKNVEQRHSLGGSLIAHKHGRKSTEEDTHDAISGEALTDMQSVPSSASPRGSSTSFTILGKNSREAQMHHSSSSSSLSLGHMEANRNSHEEFQMLRAPKPNGSNSNAYDLKKNEDVNSTPEKIPINSEILSPRSTTHLTDVQGQRNYNTLDEYIQVFPENSQSGGSNFYNPSLDSRVGGGQSCTNSSRRGPMSIIAVGNGSLPSYEYVQVEKADQKTELVQSQTNKSITLDALLLTPSGSGQPDLYNGTGARPKQPSEQPNRSVIGEESNGHGNVQQPTPDVRSTTTNAMVKIPSDYSNTYRINNAPMLSYGKQESQTEISALTSFGSSLNSFSPDKEKTEIGLYNDLNAGGQNVQSKTQTSATSTSSPNVATTEEFVIVETAPPILPSTNPIIPPIMPPPEDNELKEANVLLKSEVENLRKKTTQLHMANKEWKDRWDMLKKQTEGENVQLRAQMNHLEQEKDRMKRETEYHIASLKEELNNMNQMKKDTEKEYLHLLTGRSQEKQLLEKLKQDYGTLHQEKRALEIKLEGQEANRPVEGARPVEITKTNYELETELAVVKRQVTLFMDDFNKEHQERLALEKKLQKEKEAKEVIDTKLRKTHTLLKARDEDLRQKSKRLADLQFLVDDLKLKLEVEQRRSSIYPSMDLAMQLSVQGENETVSYAPGSTEGQGNKVANIPAHHHHHVHTTKTQKWSCPACTYENKKSHKQCEICGTSQPREARYVELN